MLNQDSLRALLHYDPLTGIFAWLVNKGPAKRGDVAGYVHTNTNGKRYRYISVNGKQYKAHRLAFLYMDGEGPADQVDHDDGNGLNNSWSNLKQATNQENAKNRRLRCTNKSGFVGVSFVKHSKKWQARININGERKSLGCFVDKMDAVEVRKAASIKHGYHQNHGSSRPL